jgi:1-acyl-sn-glycerol-3-phosphate acyltransferase
MRTLFLYFIYKIFWNAFFKIIIGVRIIGARKLQNYDQFIIAANHNSHADAVTLMTAVPTNKLATTHPIAAADYFGKNKLMSFISWFFINVKLIPRKKTEADSDNPIEIMDALLKKNKSIIIFPEGSRGKPGKLSAFKKGIGILSEKNKNIPIIPVYLEGISRVLPKGNKVILPSLTKIYFGDAIHITNESSEEIVEKVEAAIHQLKDNPKHKLIND